MKKKLFSPLIGMALFVFMLFGGFSLSGITSMAAGLGACALTSATIAGSNVVVTLTSSDLPSSDDGVYYLFAEKVYDAGPNGTPVATAPIGNAATFTFPLGHNTEASHLYDKFQVAVVQGGAFVPVTGGRYITNPEVLAVGSPARKNNGKKGLILDGAKIGNGNTESIELGVQQGAYNINLEDIIGGNRQIPFTYNGKTYYYDSNYISQYDHCVRTCTSQGMGMTMVLLNPYSKEDSFMIAPSARNGIGRYSYYLMNTSEPQGLENLEAVVAFLAFRYNGRNGLGQIDNWVIGNEVNVKYFWNYSSITDEMQYAQLYADSLRVCYNAIKSNNANAIVCFSLDQNWTKIHNSNYFSARSMLEAINAVVVNQGNFDWGLAEHPYNYPMTWTSFWTPKDAECASMMQHTIDTGYLTMENIEVLTDYMSLPYMKNTKGAVRPILLTEIGYSSTQGEEAQAAATVYAYQRAMTNSHINMIIFNRQTDSAVEMKDGLAVGLTSANGTRKLAFDYFKNMNGKDAASYIQRSAAYMGIADWNAAMHSR